MKNIPALLFLTLLVLPSVGSAQIPTQQANADLDIFAPILTYVFGEAKQGGKYALVSLYRLKKNPDGSGLPQSHLLERVAKVALHELGHLFNLIHCMDERCLMHFSGRLQDLDRASLYFCSYCSVYIREAFRDQKS